MRLALKFGMPLAELLQRVSARELAIWQAVDSLEPIGDFAAAGGALVVANAHRAQGVQAFGLPDFMPLFRPRDPEVVARNQELIQIAQFKRLAKRQAAMAASRQRQDERSEPPAAKAE